MEGLRKLARSSRFPLDFWPLPDNRFSVISVAPGANEVERRPAHLTQAELQTLFSDRSPNGISYNLRLACVQTDGSGVLYIDDGVFWGLLDAMDLDPWIEHMIRARTYGFHHSVKEGIVSYFLGTNFLWAIWTCHQ